MTPRESDGSQAGLIHIPVCRDRPLRAPFIPRRMRNRPRRRSITFSCCAVSGNALAAGDDHNVEMDCREVVHGELDARVELPVRNPATIDLECQ